ncbi:hypothetical protein L1987_74516 [Smallanthus sonchifolius]|uniref:Uncharacterized protein n=1 Tax=Smallanthus sonchifolius TaxID=185202 RepID=A0ACB9A2Z8_9ASTR|nr:hypothetical protein L1987_74516 [Smallanthus sonchifolius]
MGGTSFSSSSSYSSLSSSTYAYAILKLQVGSSNTGRSLQRDLNRIAESADISTSKGFNYVLQETIVALLWHSDYCISGYSSVTIIVAARGVPDLPLIKSNEQLKKAFQKLASISSSNIMGVEVLWTPQKEDDSLTEQQMLKDYPLLRPL